MKMLLLYCLTALVVAIGNLHFKWLPFSSFWSFFFALCTSYSIFAYAGEFIRVGIAPKKFSLLLAKNTKLEDVLKWLRRNRLHMPIESLDHPEDTAVLVSGLFASCISLAILSFYYIPTPTSTIGQIVLAIFCLIIAIIFSSILSLLLPGKFIKKQHRAVVEIIKSSDYAQCKTIRMKWVLEAVRDGKESQAVAELTDLGKKDMALLLRTMRENETEIEMKKAAIQALAELKDKIAIEPMVVALKDMNAILRRMVEEALWKIDENWMKSDGAKAAVPSLISALTDKNSDVRKEAATTLGQISDTRAIEHLVIAFLDESNTVRGAVEKALLNIDSEWMRSEGAKAAIQPLIAAFNQEDNKMRDVTARVLGWIGDQRAFEPLLKVALDVHNANLQEVAKAALVNIDPSWMKSETARAAVPNLIAALKDENVSVRRAAVLALGEIRDPRALEPLLVAFKHEDWNVREAIMEALNKIDLNWKKSKSWKAVILSFAETLNDKDKESRISAAQALGKVGDMQAMESLLAALTDENNDVVRATIMDAISKIDPNWTKSDRAKSVVPTLVAALIDESRDIVRTSIMKALNKIDPNWEKSEGAKATIPSFISALNAKGSTVRAAAIETLEKIDPNWTKSETALSAVPTLAAALWDKDSEIQKTARVMLERIASKEALEALRHYEDAATLKLILSSLGKSIQSNDVNSLLEILGEHKIEQDGDIRYYLYKNKGIQLTFYTDGTLINTFLYSEGVDGFRQYQGALPRNLSFQDTRRDVEKKFGEPQRLGEAVGGAGSRVYADYPSMGIRIMYDSGFSSEMSSKVYVVTLYASKR